jgi:organic hydroperoxide reductase OsmC/OhrA
MRHVSKAVGTGGRMGTIASESGSYRHDVTLPGEKRNGVIPEELIAGAWVACFGATFIEIAEARRIDATEVAYEASVVLESSGTEYTITEAWLEVMAGDIERSKLERLIETTHQHCPVSKLLTAGARSVEVRAGERTAVDDAIAN